MRRPGGPGWEGRGSAPSLGAARGLSPSPSRWCQRRVAPCQSSVTLRALPPPAGPVLPPRGARAGPPGPVPPPCKGRAPGSPRLSPSPAMPARGPLCRSPCSGARAGTPPWWVPGRPLWVAGPEKSGLSGLQGSRLGKGSAPPCCCPADPRLGPDGPGMRLSLWMCWSLGGCGFAGSGHSCPRTLAPGRRWPARLFPVRFVPCVLSNTVDVSQPLEEEASRWSHTSQTEGLCSMGNKSWGGEICLK